MKGIFSIVPDKMDEPCSQMGQMAKSLKETNESITVVVSHLHMQNAAEGRIKSALTALAMEVMRESEEIGRAHV